MKLGYVRVSKADESQTTAPQLAALREAGCVRLFEDRMTGARWDRPELHKALDQLRPGDVFVVWKLDRLSRSLKDLLHLMDQIKARGADFQSVTESIDTATPAGRMLMQMVGAFAEFEREMIRERTRAGLEAARQAGRVGGRPPKLKPRQQQEILEGVQEGRYTQAEAARLFEVHPATITRMLAKVRQHSEAGSDLLPVTPARGED